MKGSMRGVGVNRWEGSRTHMIGRGSGDMGWGEGYKQGVAGRWRRDMSHTSVLSM